MYSEGERRGYYSTTLNLSGPPGTFTGRVLSSKGCRKWIQIRCQATVTDPLWVSSLAKLTRSQLSQYKCHKLRRTWASSSPIPSSEVSKRELASKRSSGSRKALSTRTATPGKALLSHAKSATLWDHTLSNTYASTVGLSPCPAVERQFQCHYRQQTVHLFGYADFSSYTKMS